MTDAPLLATLRPIDVDPESPIFDYATFALRMAGRAIIFDEGLVALIHVTKHGYYMLPGGGIDGSENVVSALRREVREEVGCEIEMTDVLGSIETYLDRWKQRQVDTCYTARKLDGGIDSVFTGFEQSEGFTPLWTSNLAEAIRLIRGEIPGNRDGKLVRARDLMFLEYCAQSLGSN